MQSQGAILPLHLQSYPDTQHREGSARSQTQSPARPSPLPAADSIIDIPVLHPVQITEPRVPYPNQQITVPPVVVRTQEIPEQHVCAA